MQVVDMQSLDTEVEYGLKSREDGYFRGVWVVVVVVVSGRWEIQRWNIEGGVTLPSVGP
jgi:hypothetical protein